MLSMTRKSDRKLFLFGRYSLALLLPKKWLRELSVEAGQEVLLEFDKSRRRIVVRLSGLNTPKPPKKVAKRPESQDWEEIPSL